MSAEDFKFDGVETEQSFRNTMDGCDECPYAWHEHDKERVYPDDGPAGSWHYNYICP